MQEFSNLSPLIESSVYRPFISAVSEIGLPDLPEHELIQKLTPHLVSAGSSIQDNSRVLTKFAQSILHGEIISAEASDSGIATFFVRGGVGRTGIHVRVTCTDHAWNLESVHFIHSRPLRQSRWFNRSVVSAAILFAAVIGYLIHTPVLNPGQSHAPKSTPAIASNNQTASANQVTPSNQMNRTSTNEPSSNTTTSPSGQAPPKTITYHLAAGTSLHNLSQFLSAHQLVSSAINFDMAMKKSGVDRDVKPGTYVFPTGGTTSQFISILRKGPTK